MNLTEIRSKLQSGQTIESVCREYNLTFQQLIDMMFQLGAEEGYHFRRRGSYDMGKGHFSSTGQLYISTRDGKYYIRNKGRWFGTYSTLEDAIKVRDWFILNGRWDKRWVNRACKECNVERCKR